MATPQPAIVILQGGWHRRVHYADIVSRFRDAGFIAEQPEIPSMGSTLPLKYGKADDIACVREAITRLADAGHPIIIYMHSYGGVYGSDAVAGLTWKDRQGKGGVVHMLYQAAFVIPKGQSLLSPWNGNLPEFMGEDVEKGNCWLNDFRVLCFSGLNDEDAKKYGDQLVYCPSSVLRDPVENEPWRDCPCTYLVCRGDMALPTALQEALATTVGPHTRVEYTDGSHDAFLDQPERVVEVVKGVWEVAKSYISDSQ